MDVCGSMMLMLYAFTGASVSMASVKEVGKEGAKLRQVKPAAALIRVIFNQI